jgi:hypothetical protein
LIGLGDREAFSKLKTNNPFSGELILDPEKQILQACKVRVTPFAFILDEKGVVKGKGLCNGLEHINGLISSLKSQSDQWKKILVKKGVR